MRSTNSIRFRHVGNVVLGLAIAVRALSQESYADRTSGNQVMPEYVQEFFMSEAVRCQEKGEVQLTLVTNSLETGGPVAAIQTEYGLTDRLQLSVEAPYGMKLNVQRARDPSQWGPIDVGILYAFIRKDHPFAMSAGMIIEVPVTSNENLGYEPVFLVAKTFRQLQVHASVLSEIEEMQPSFEYNLASVYPVKPHWFPTFEVNGRRRDSKNTVYITPGMYRDYRKRIEIGIGLAFGVAGPAAATGVIAKVNWEFGGRDEQ
jgi:hypothetical protein